MIYTVTFSPSLDYIIGVKNLTPGAVNRTDYEKILPGGKGINVSIVLKNLGIESRALGFKGGFVGEEIEKRARNFGVNCDFIEAEGISRINVKIKSDMETEINGQGVKIAENHLLNLYDKLDEAKDGDIIVLAGAIPNSLPSDSYENILMRLKDRKVKFVVDATGSLLTRALEFKPFLIKPNHKELSEIIGRELVGEAELTKGARELQRMGAMNVLVSRAKDGGILITENGEVYSSLPPKGKVINSTGAGDSMVAGFLAGYISSGDYGEAFLTGLCAGSASAFSTELATGNEVYKLLKSLKEV